MRVPVTLTPWVTLNVVFVSSSKACTHSIASHSDNTSVKMVAEHVKPHSVSWLILTSLKMCDSLLKFHKARVVVRHAQ